MSILLDDEVSHAAYRFYSKLRALAWGEPTLRLPMGKLMHVVGLGQSQVYEYARSLRDRNGLLFHCADDVFECSFPDLPSIPEIPEKPNLSLVNSKPKTKSPARESANSGKAGKRKTTDARTQHAAIQACRSIMGRYPPKEIYDDLIKVLGDKPDMGKLQTFRKEWVKRYNPNAWTWALEWYVTGLPAHVTGNGRKGPAAPDTGTKGPWRARGGSQ